MDIELFLSALYLDEILEFRLTSSLKKYVFHNWLINNILYFRVT